MYKKTSETDLIDDAQKKLDSLFDWSVVMACPPLVEGKPIRVHVCYRNISSFEALRMLFYSVYYEYHDRSPDKTKKEEIDSILDYVILAEENGSAPGMN